MGLSEDGWIDSSASSPWGLASVSCIDLRGEMAAVRAEIVALANTRVFPQHSVGYECPYGAGRQPAYH